MKILQVGNTDVVGTRFNGQDLHHEFTKRGIESSHCVWAKESADEGTWPLAVFRGKGFITRCVCKIENLLSLQSLLYPLSWKLPFDKRFRSVDIVHYHLIHTGYFSIASLPLLTGMKPSVWTLHDPWAMTGHCIYPYDCEKWKTGCRKCRNLDTNFPIRRDRTALMWRLKKLFYHLSKIDVILASKYMYDMAKQSPLLSKFRLHHIPFGLDLNVFRPLDVEEQKRKLGVFPGSFVVTFRAATSEYKGLPFIKECLHKLSVERPVCLLTFNGRGLVDEFRGKYQIIDLGWVNDNDLTVQAYNATDVFLMPSTAEAFGMMAMEAMACGKPVITFEGTSLPEVVFAPYGGIAVPQRDADALKVALERFINNPEETRRLGGKALELARQHYDIKTHVDRILSLYKDVIERRRSAKDAI